MQSCVQPFLSADSSLAVLFPPKHLATSVPVYFALALVCLVVFNVGWTLIACQVEAYRNQAKAKAGKQQ